MQRLAHVHLHVAVLALSAQHLQRTELQGQAQPRGS
jgi:hypothetical protein